MPHKSLKWPKIPCLRLHIPCTALILDEPMNEDLEFQGYIYKQISNSRENTPAWFFFSNGFLCVTIAVCPFKICNGQGSLTSSSTIFDIFDAKIWKLYVCKEKNIRETRQKCIFKILLFLKKLEIKTRNNSSRLPSFARLALLGPMVSKHLVVL